jgi:hypothetical protein
MLSHAVIKSAQPHNKPYKLFDEFGLYLPVAPSGRCGLSRHRLSNSANRNAKIPTTDCNEMAQSNLGAVGVFSNSDYSSNRFAVNRGKNIPTRPR